MEVETRCKATELKRAQKKNERKKNNTPVRERDNGGGKAVKSVANPTATNGINDAESQSPASLTDQKRLSRAMRRWPLRRLGRRRNDRFDSPQKSTPPMTPLPFVFDAVVISRRPSFFDSLRVAIQVVEI